MFPIIRPYAEFGLKVAILRGDLSLAKSCFLSIRNNWHWLDWNLPIFAAESLSFIPEIDDHWSFVSGLVKAKKSKAAYALAKLLFIDETIPIVKDFKSYIQRTKSYGELFRHVRNKPISVFLKTLAFAVDYLDPLIRFRDVPPPIATPGASRLSWWAYPEGSHESRAICTTIFRHFSTDFFDYEFNTLFQYIVSEGYPIDNHIDYENLYKTFGGNLLSLADNYFSDIDKYARQAAYIIEQVQQGGHSDRFGMVGEE